MVYRDMDLLKKIKQELKFWEGCSEYGLGPWQCPKFLFVVMGGMTILAMVATHLIAVKYAEPNFVVMSVVGIAIVIFTIGNVVVQSFEKMAEANRMKSEFISIASHQLRTPLTSLKWLLAILLSGRLGRVEGKQLEYAESMKASNDRMIELVNDLLNVSRVEQGRIAFKKERFELGELVQERAAEEINFAKANNVTLEVRNLMKEGSPIEGDRRYVGMAFTNLVDNAIRYTATKGDVKIILRKNGRFARVEVRDRGVGIPKDDQHNIFQKFFRSANAMRHKTEGTGLGLYLAKAFVELHKGKIGFTSQENQGSTFWFELPIKRAI